MIICHTCGKDEFDSYQELALHIATNKKTHKKGQKWATKVLMKVNELDRKFGKPEERTPLTEQEKENKQDCRIELSGQRTYVNAQCPQCKRQHPEVVEIEYAKSETAWKCSQNTFMILCQGCRRN